MKQSETKKIIIDITKMFLLSRLLLIFVVAIFKMVSGEDCLSNVVNSWDSGWYNYIAQNGYGIDIPLNEANHHDWAFFPLYPFMMRLVKLVTRCTSWDTAGMIVSNICTLVAGIVSVKYVKLTRPDMKDPYLPTILMFFGPWSFYFFLNYTEGLFCMLLVIFFYYVKKKRYLLAAAAAAFASATRVVGVLLVFVLIWNIIVNEMDKKNPKELVRLIIRNPKTLLSVLLCPLGAFSYMLMLYFKSGDVWAFMRAQQAWGRDSKGIYMFVTSFRETGNVVHLMLSLVIIICFLLYFRLLREKRWDEGGYAIVTAVIPFVSGLYSMIRYFSGTYFIHILVAQWLERNERYKDTILAVMIVAECVLFYYWMVGTIYLI